MRTRVAVTGLEIEHTDNSTEVLLRLQCDVPYEAAVLYDALISSANRGGLKLDFEMVERC